MNHAPAFASYLRTEERELEVGASVTTSRVENGTDRWPVLKPSVGPRSQAADCLALRCGGKHRFVRQLPDDLAAMAETELSEQRAVRDDKLAHLFRRWPALSRLELGQLRRMYAERLRIARYVGRRRARD